jgi:hypothetical protein
MRLWSKVPDIDAFSSRGCIYIWVVIQNWLPPSMRRTCLADDFLCHNLAESVTAGGVQHQRRPGRVGVYIRGMLIECSPESRFFREVLEFMTPLEGWSAVRHRWPEIELRSNVDGDARYLVGQPGRLKYRATWGNTSSYRSSVQGQCGEGGLSPLPRVTRCKTFKVHCSSAVTH